MVDQQELPLEIVSRDAAERDDISRRAAIHLHRAPSKTLKTMRIGSPTLCSFSRSTGHPAYHCPRWLTAHRPWRLVTYSIGAGSAGGSSLSSSVFCG